MKGTADEGACASLRGEGDNLARYDCNTLSQYPYVHYWRAGPEALTVKTTVPITCTPPFSEILSSRALSEPEDSRLQPAKHRLRAM
jgi:hypothetical protein